MAHHLERADQPRQRDVSDHERPEQGADAVQRAEGQITPEEWDGFRLPEQDGATQHQAAQREGQAAERDRLADLQRGQAPMGIQAIAHRGPGHRRETQIVRQGIGAERGEGDASVADLVAGVDGAEPVVEGEDEVGDEGPDEGEDQGRDRDGAHRLSDVAHLQMAELVLHHVDRAEQQGDAQECRQMTKDAFHWRARALSISPTVSLIP